MHSIASMHDITNDIIDLKHVHYASILNSTSYIINLVVFLLNYTSNAIFAQN